MLCFSINIQKNASSKWNITGGENIKLFIIFSCKNSETLARFDDVHTIVLFSVIAAPLSLRGGFVLKSKRHSPQDSLLREISPRIRQDTESEEQNREAEKLSWLAMGI